ncbi:MAG: sigma-70 region 2 domain protein [Gemmatimonadetes bacterium]|nr:sigma-70 region 2 domain protein [Gemmatimonadota bacterium]
MSEGHEIPHLLRDLAPQVLGAVSRRHDDFAAAEDAVQDALIAASTQWPVEGIPANPRGWLYHVAMRRITDHLRSELARRRREEAVGGELWAEWAFVPPPDGDVNVERDDTLLLLFMCCHPALSTSSAIALTLRAVGGLTTAEIANAFLVPEATMAQRISRAKQAIKASGASFIMPDAAGQEARLGAVLHVLYLVFNEGYTSSVGPDLNRTDLSSEAIRLARAIHAARPGDREVTGLLALMLLTDARRAARTGAGGELIPLDEQDRSRWNRELIEEGSALVARALTSSRRPGPYQLQAAIAALHDEAESTATTDWSEIRAFYELLMSTSDNPMASLSHAIATAMVDGPQAGLALLAELERDTRVAKHYRLHAVRAHFLEMAGDARGARASYLQAGEGTTSLPERNYLFAKAARLRESAG